MPRSQSAPPAPRPSRRDFLKRGAAFAAAAFPAIIPGRALGLNGATPPSDRIAVGFIGVGKMNRGHLQSFRADRSVQVTALCDVWSDRLEMAREETEDYYARRDAIPGYKGCATYGDYRELCADPNVDAVIIATPNHWHALNAVEAARQGKDIYLEKPLARTIGEGQAIRDAVRRHGRILQTGSQQRSDSAFRLACELVRNGRIGKVTEVFVNVAGPPEEFYAPAEPTPEPLDWDMWLGPAPWRPYNAIICPDHTYDGWPRWRDFRDYAGGMMTDFGAHHYDIAQWALGMDHTAPVEIIPPDGKDHPRLTYVYANGIRMYHGGAASGAAVEFVGTEGRVRVNRGQFLETDPPHLRHERIGPNEIPLYDSPNHKDNWLEGIRTRREPICPVEVGHNTATVCHIGNIAYWLGRPLRWDPEAEHFPGDPDANRLIHRPMRAPWKL